MTFESFINNENGHIAWDVVRAFKKKTKCVINYLFIGKILNYVNCEKSQINIGNLRTE